MTDDAIEALLLSAGYRPGDPVTAAILRALVAAVEADCAARARAVADAYRPYIGDGRIDTQAQIARNAAMSCVAAMQ